MVRWWLGLREDATDAVTTSLLGTHRGTSAAMSLRFSTVPFPVGAGRSMVRVCCHGLSLGELNKWQ